MINGIVIAEDTDRSSGCTNQKIFEIFLLLDAIGNLLFLHGIDSEYNGNEIPPETLFKRW
jgi:hypothetical protein